MYSSFLAFQAPARLTFLFREPRVIFLGAECPLTLLGLNIEVQYIQATYINCLQNQGLANRNYQACTQASVQNGCTAGDLQQCEDLKTKLVTDDALDDSTSTRNSMSLLYNHRVCCASFPRTFCTIAFCGHILLSFSGKVFHFLSSRLFDAQKMPEYELYSRTTVLQKFRWK